MIALFDGQDYLLILDKEKGELRKLSLKEKLEAQLKMMWESEELGKKVILEFGENDGSDGIELKYFPEKHNGWDAIKEVRVKVNQRAYNHVLERGRFGTRYNSSDKIEIYNGDPLDYRE